MVRASEGRGYGHQRGEGMDVRGMRVWTTEGRGYGRQRGDGISSDI